MAWIKGNRYLSTSEMQNNAKLVYTYLINRGWSLNAISGMLGNMQRESTINPGIWQSLIEGSGGGGGFGLVQWTPYTNFTNWADSNGYEWDDGDAQLKWINEETVSTGQWIATSNYAFTFAAFKKSTETPEYLASTFLMNFERAGVSAESERRTNARNWYNYLLENGGSGETNNNQQIINDAVEWAVNIANDDTHGYDQANRQGPDYDCSSLCINAYQQAGINVKGAGASYTGNMKDAFVSCGFDAISYSSGMTLLKGDIILNESDHVVIYIGNNQVVNASINELGTTTGGETGDQTGTEIYIRSMYEYSSGWDYVLRLPVSDSGSDEPDEPDEPEKPNKIPTTKLSKLLLYAVASDII